MEYFDCGNFNELIGIQDVVGVGFRLIIFIMLQLRIKLFLCSVLWFCGTRYKMLYVWGVDTTHPP